MCPAASRDRRDGAAATPRGRRHCLPGHRVSRRASVSGMRGRAARPSVHRLPLGPRTKSTGTQAPASPRPTARPAICMTVCSRSRRHVPAGVSVTPRACRSRSWVPNPSSSLRSCSDIAGWLTFRSRAARPRLPVSATLRKYRRSRRPSAFSRVSLCRDAGSARIGKVTAFIRRHPPRRGKRRAAAAPGSTRVSRATQGASLQRRQVAGKLGGE